MLSRAWFLAVSCCAAVCVAGCGSDASTPADAGADAPSGDAPAVSQLPPITGRADIEAWIATGAYRSWHCEPAPHAARSPSPHGSNRICSNDALSGTASGDYPVGAAAVKELLDGGGNVIGYAVYRKVSATPSDGSNWYWYERVPLDSSAPHDANGVVADGMGGTGPANGICVGCHSHADTGTPPGRDFVFTQVR